MHDIKINNRNIECNKHWLHIDFVIDDNITVSSSVITNTFISMIIISMMLEDRLRKIKAS